MMWLAFVAAFLVLERDFARHQINGDPHTLIALGALSGLIGAKLWHVFESPHELAADPTGVIFSRTGFAWYGGFVAGILTIVFLARRWHVPILRMLDACAPATALGYAVGRIGCLLSGDGDYGKPTSLPWGMSFPNGLVPTTERVHPTPIYEFLVCAVIAWVLWRRGARPLPQGEILAGFLVLMGLERFLVEFIRINPRIFFGMSNAQMASAITAMAGVALWCVVRAKGHPEAQTASVRV